MTRKPPPDLSEIHPELLGGNQRERDRAKAAAAYVKFTSPWISFSTRC
jgi:hypothetical protein